MEKMRLITQQLAVLEPDGRNCVSETSCGKKSGKNIECLWTTDGWAGQTSQKKYVSEDGAVGGGQEWNVGCGIMSARGTFCVTCMRGSIRGPQRGCE